MATQELDPFVIATTIDGRMAHVERKKLIRAVHCYAVIVRDGRVLISPQWKDMGFVFPGGSVELGEDHVQGLIREVKEETGYEIKPRGIIDAFTSIYANFKTKKAQHSLLIYYAADVVRGRISTDGFDVHEREYAKQARWVSLEELNTMHFTCNTQEPIKVIRKWVEEKINSQL